MKKSLMIASSVALIASLAACGKKAEVPKPTETADAGAMSAKPGASKIEHGKSTGTVTAIDLDKGSVTFDHTEISALKWPPMTMSFAATPELLKGIKVGDKVAFEIDWDGKAGTVTSIRKSD